jgi:hypothetical protein
MQHVCVCGHPRAAHEHYRRGTNCSLCVRGACHSYRSSTNVVRWVLTRLRTSAAPRPH